MTSSHIESPCASPECPAIDTQQMENSEPWIEKYRPSDVELIVLDPNIKKQIDIFTLNQPGVHLIINGLPGTGKTTTAKCIAKKILGGNTSKGYLELNAADDRGVKNISAIIPNFCKKVSDVTTKIILLDEADNMTPKCQHDINGMIKEYGKKTKFIFTCNESSKIIEDLQSVCRIIRFKNLTNEQISKQLTKICANENIPCEKSGLDIICYIAKGDMRKSINDLQKTAYTFGKITKETVLDICKVPDPDDIMRIVKLCQDKKLCEANIETENIIKEGYYSLDIISSFVHAITNYDIIEDLKIRLIEIIYQTKITATVGLRSKLQISGMICRLTREFINSGH